MDTMVWDANDMLVPVARNLVAIVSDGYVFVDDADGMVNLYPVRSRTPIISEAEAALADNGYRVAADWQPTRVAAQMVAPIVRI